MSQSVACESVACDVQLALGCCGSLGRSPATRKAVKLALGLEYSLFVGKLLVAVAHFSQADVAGDAWLAGLGGESTRAAPSERQMYI